MTTDEEALRALYDRYGPVIFSRCRAILGNDEDAMDAMQETFARVIKHRAAFRAESSPLTWMYRISTNYCLNQLRNRSGRREKRHINRELLVGDGTTPPDAERADDVRVIRRLLAETDEQTRAIVTYLYFDDMTREEAARMVGISLPTLRKRLRHFMKRSRRVLEQAPVPAALLLVLLGAWAVLP